MSVGPTHAEIRRIKLARALFKDVSWYIHAPGFTEEESALRALIGMEVCRAAAAEMERRERAKVRKKAKAAKEKR